MKEWLARTFPRLASLRWWFHALADAARPPRSYAQNGEDAVLLEWTRQRSIARGFYIDIGANHPTRLSNTYALYRAGWNGITVEPNRAFRSLHLFFRPRDVFVNVGVGRAPGLLRFHHHVWAVLSGFGSQSEEGARASEFLPVLPLDALQPLCPSGETVVLSIDVEGLNGDVLRSGPGLLGRVDFVVIEYGSEEAEITAFLHTQGFTVAERTAHNLLAGRGASAASR